MFGFFWGPFRKATNISGRGGVMRVTSCSGATCFDAHEADKVGELLEPFGSFFLDGARQGRWPRRRIEDTLGLARLAEGRDIRSPRSAAGNPDLALDPL